MWILSLGNYKKEVALEDAYRDLKKKRKYIYIYIYIYIYKSFESLYFVTFFLQNVPERQAERRSVI